MEQIIQNKAPKPAGLLPKNLQAFVLVGLALVMVGIMALTGKKRPKTPIPPTPSSVPDPAPVNTGKVADFAKDIEKSEQESAPQAEAALLQLQKQMAAQRPPSQFSRTYPNGSPASSAYANGSYAAAPPQPAEGHPTDALNTDGSVKDDPIREDEQKREYLSLFADNVALSYRKNAQARASQGSLQGAALPDSTSDPNVLFEAALQMARESKTLGQIRPAGAFTPNGTATPTPSANTLPNTATDLRTINPSAPRSAVIANVSSGKNYLLFEGTLIDALLVNRLDGSFAGPVICLVSDNIYSHDREHLLIPVGSKALGEAAKVSTFGQTRLAVTFHRLIMPDGYSINLDQLKGLDQQGASALKDKVNNHYARIFGASLAIGILGGAAQLGTGDALDQTASDRMREGFGVSMANSGEDILNRFLNVLPTVTIREGTRIKIYLADDLLLPDYRQHHMPADL